MTDAKIDVSISRSAVGYLVNPDDWTREIGQQLAAEEEIELNDEIWFAIQFMRDYYFEHKIAPDVRHLIAHVAKNFECDKKEAKKKVFFMFPYGYVKQACKIAGMKEPRAWSTG